LAVLNRYADQVLSDLFEPIHQSLPLDAILEALFVFAAEDPKMEKGCVFYKMRAGKHRLGPDTLARVQALDAGAVDAFTQYLEARRMAGDWVSTLSAEQGARYLVEQIGLALTQRAAGEDPGMVRDMLKLALSAIKPK
jgi:hypothetical protein